MMSDYELNELAQCAHAVAGKFPNVITVCATDLAWILDEFARTRVEVKALRAEPRCNCDCNPCGDCEADK